MARRDSILMDLMKTMMNFVIAFDKKYDDEFIPNRNADILKDMLGSDAHIAMSDQS